MWVVFFFRNVQHNFVLFHVRFESVFFCVYFFHLNFFFSHRNWSKNTKIYACIPNHFSSLNIEIETHYRWIKCDVLWLITLINYCIMPKMSNNFHDFCFQVEKESKIFFDNFVKLSNDGNAQIIVFDGFLSQKKKLKFVLLRQF